MAAPSVEDAYRAGQLILVAEDNETNCDVLQAQLALLGYAADVAHDGVQALAMWRTGRYALLLTDWHMPHMDGLQLTAAIRQAEGPGAYLPIIAISANVLQEHVKRCLASGIDDHLAKPLRLSELRALLKKLPRATDEPLDGTPSLAQPDAQNALPVWDALAFREILGDDTDLQRHIMTKFLASSPKQLSAMAAAHFSGDLALLADLSHSLKSGARAVGAMQFGDLCEQLDNAGSGGDALHCAGLAAQLPQAWVAAEQAIKSHLAI
ncbi:MAG: response regulator [Comamonadaceae bacterium]|nr:response regulator [Comamonadaceae bacterium]